MIVTSLGTETTNSFNLIQALTSIFNNFVSVHIRFNDFDACLFALNVNMFVYSCHIL